jgi:hypothetical protein
MKDQPSRDEFHRRFPSWFGNAQRSNSFYFMASAQ